MVYSDLYHISIAMAVIVSGDWSNRVVSDLRPRLSTFYSSNSISITSFYTTVISHNIKTLMDKSECLSIQTMFILLRPIY